MNKKEARQKKNQLKKSRNSRDILGSEIIGDQEEETLLGNLADVKQIPMIIWHVIPVMPIRQQVITLPTTGKSAWMWKLLEEVSQRETDLIGFTTVKNMDEGSFDDVAPGTVGIAAQVCKIEKTVVNTALVTLKGICRYENLGFLPAPEDYFNINVRWFEDDKEPESVVLPLYERYLKNIEHIARIGGTKMKNFFNVSKTVRYDLMAAQYTSFMLINLFENWFTLDEQLELLKSVSTVERLTRINERAEMLLPFIEIREKNRAQGRNN